MPSQGLAEIAKLAMNFGYQAYANGYTEHPLIYPQITTRLATVTHPGKGHRAIASVGLGDLERRDPGQRYAADSTREGYIRQLAIRNYGKTMSVTREDIEAAGGLAAFEAKVVDFATEVGKAARLTKDRIVADIYQDGRLSAGSDTVFDQAFTGQADANLGLIYDGKPFFAATSNAHPFKAYTATSDEGVNLTVTSVLSTATLQTAITRVGTNAGRDERGKTIQIVHPKLMVPRGLEFTAAQILNSTNVAETANNGINVIRGRMDLVVNPHIADSATASAWWTLDPAAVKVYDEDAPRIRVWEDYETNSIVMAVDVMFGAAPWDWRYASLQNAAAS